MQYSFFFLSFISYFLVGSWVAVQAQECANGIVERKEVRDMTREEWNNYASAVQQLNADENGRFREICDLHESMASTVHDSLLFFPWHRRLITEYERALQAINPSVTVPYWDWSTVDAQDPLSSRVLTDEFFGGSGQRSCILDGPFRDFRAHNRRRCVMRDYNPNPRRRPAFVQAATLERLRARERTFRDFSFAFELDPHALPHMVLGGDRGDMSSMAACNDPLFYSHHAFVDLQWDLWQREQNNFGYDGNRRTRMGGFQTNDRIEDVLRVEDLCFRYKPWTPGSNEPTSDIVGVRPNITDDWLDKNGIDKDRAREVEDVVAEIEGEVNGGAGEGGGADQTTNQVTFPVTSTHRNGAEHSAPSYQYFFTFILVLVVGRFM